MSTLAERDLKRLLFASIKDAVIKHLTSLSNQHLNVPVPDHKDVSVRELTSHVEKETTVGITYMSEWFKTTLLIKEVRQKS